MGNSSSSHGKLHKLQYNGAASSRNHLSSSSSSERFTSGTLFNYHKLNIPTITCIVHLNGPVVLTFYCNARPHEGSRVNVIRISVDANKMRDYDKQCSRNLVVYVSISTFWHRSAVRAGKTVFGDRGSSRRTGRDNCQVETTGPWLRFENQR